MASQEEVLAFKKRWEKSGGNELANSQPFLVAFCHLLGLPEHQPAQDVNEENVYSFERKVFLPRGDGSEDFKRLDFYKQGCFILESKQGRDVVKSSLPKLPRKGRTTSTAVARGSRAWEELMSCAKRQAVDYARALPRGEGRPPFIIVADVGYCFDLYSEFSCTGGNYLPYPDARSNRFFLADFVDPDVQELFRTIWDTPHTLDPSLRAAKVTTEISRYLAALAKSLEAAGHGPEQVASFLIRCLFSMFAEDVGLLPPRAFQDILARAADSPEGFGPSVHDLWSAMDKGTFSIALQKTLKRFNGQLFANPAPLPLSVEQIEILLEAAKADWREVEPAIFGTLLEQALSTRERHALGAHYTPRAYVERLVLPAVIDPLREEWADVQATAALLGQQGKPKDAQAEITAFLRRLCAVKVLDPACGSGNFLYVALEHMKRLEGEVLAEAATYGEYQRPLEAQGLTVDPHQFLGLELNPRAAHIAEMVLWIGYLQWHFRTHGTVAPPEPIIRKFDNIKNRDALISCTESGPILDDNGEPVTHWDGKTKKLDPTTCREVPDESARVPEFYYSSPVVADWPEADFIVGNPPFIGGGVKRSALGSGYFEALTETYPDLPEACDFVMYWWHRAAQLVRAGQVRRFGFITTNSLGQVFNRRVTAAQLNAEPPLSLAFAVPDHPWVDSTDGAAVRIAMTVGAPGAVDGTLATVIAETPGEGAEVQVSLAKRVGRINSDLTIGADVAGAVRLKANADLSCPGVKLHGSGFIVTPAEAAALGLGRVEGLEKHIRPYRNGKDITGKPRGVLVIDLFGLSEADVRDKFPDVFQRVKEHVKPERDQNNRDTYRDNWWIFGEPRRDFRPALAGLRRFIATPETAKHRFFVFLDGDILPDNMVVNIATASAYHLGVLSSRVHVAWALAAGGTLEDRPRYNKTPCFEKFPFPDPTPEQKDRIRDLAEKLDALRKEKQALHTDLTLTDLYNALEALREGRKPTPKEQAAHDKGAVVVLKDYHDALDQAVFDAYGWPATLTDDEILSRLVELNQLRAGEEENGRVLWLRPAYQHPKAPKVAKQAKMALDTPPKAGKKPRKTAKPAAKTKPTPWPGAMLEQFRAVRAALLALGGEADAEAVAKTFARAPRARVVEVLETLAGQGFIRAADGGTFFIV